MSSAPSRRSILASAAGLAATTAVPGAGRSAPVTKPAGAASLDPEALRADARIVRQAYRAMHPGLYRYNSPARMEARFAALEHQMASASTRQAAFLALTRLTAAVRCGHSYPSPYNMSDAAVTSMFDGPDRLPFLFDWIQGEMVATARSPVAPIDRGDRIVRINGIPTRTMLKCLIPLARADGSNDAKRIANMAVLSEDRFPAFDVYRPLLWPDRGPEVHLDIARQGASDRPLVAPLLTRQQPRDLRSLQDEAASPWSFELGKDGVGLLTMPNWALYDSDFPWEAWLDGVMDQLVEAGAPGLIIDLRDNEGGLDCGNAILARLIQRDLTLPAYDRYTRYRTAPKALEPFLKTWDRSFLDWDSAARGPDERGLYRLVRYDDTPDGDLVTPKGPRFPGKVAVLVGAQNSSATFQFALAVKSAGLGTLIGQTTGGNLRGINGGAFFFLQLPGSGLEIDLPLIATLPRTPQPDAGLAPDMAVTRNALALAEGRDLELEAARDWMTRT